MGACWDGAGVFFENGDNPETPNPGWYFTLVVKHDIREISTGPFPDKESAMKAAEVRFQEELEKT